MTEADYIFHLDEAIAIAEAHTAEWGVTPDGVHPNAVALAWRTMFKLPYNDGDRTSMDFWRRTAEYLRSQRDGIVAEAQREIRNALTAKGGA